MIRIVPRCKGTINAIISNAGIFLQLQQDYGSFDKYIWKFVDHTPIFRYKEVQE
ncbi:MAG: DNA-3-methyladenine glycosylase I [Candidatus Heimdallarchaeota archaeon]|nr:DNA-3-methyladenine glycosylase I [Candidatus Heimdallarchaeota archaeon]